MRLFCLELRSDSWWDNHAVENRREGTYQGHSSDLSFLLSRMTNCVMGLAFWLLLRHISNTAFPVPLTGQTWPLFRCSSAFSSPLFPLLTAKELILMNWFSSLRLISCTLSSFDHESGQRTPSHTAEVCVLLLPVSTILRQERGSVAFFDFKCQSHEIFSVKNNGTKNG